MAFATAATAATAATSTDAFATAPRILARASTPRKVSACLGSFSYAIEWAEEDSLHQEERLYLKYALAIVGEKGVLLFEDHFLYNTVLDQYFLMDSVEGHWNTSAEAFVFSFTQKKQAFHSFESLVEEWLSRSLQGFTRLTKKILKTALMNQYDQEW